MFLPLFSGFCIYKRFRPDFKTKETEEKRQIRGAPYEPRERHNEYEFCSRKIAQSKFQN